MSSPKDLHLPKWEKLRGTDNYSEWKLKIEDIIDVRHLGFHILFDNFKPDPAKTKFEVYTNGLSETPKPAWQSVSTLFRKYFKFCNHGAGKPVISMGLHAKYGLSSSISTEARPRHLLKCTGRAAHGRFRKVQRKNDVLLGPCFHLTL